MPVTLHDILLRKLLRRVYFINGTAYAGKSTMVRMPSRIMASSSTSNSLYIVCVLLASSDYLRLSSGRRTLTHVHPGLLCTRRP